MSTAADRDEYGHPIGLAAYGTSFSSSLSDLTGGAGLMVDLGRGEDSVSRNNAKSNSNQNKGIHFGEGDGAQRTDKQTSQPTSSSPNRDRQ